MKKKMITAVLAGAMLTASMNPFTASAEEASETTLAAAEAAVEGVTLKDTEAETPIAYDADHDCILGIGEFSTITYTVPEGTEGTYDLYLEISKASNAFVAGSTPITVAVNGGKVLVPSVAVAPCTMAQMGITGDPVSYMDDMGLFKILADTELKAGDVITIGGVAGSEFCNDGSFASSLPAIGDLTLVPAGTEKMVGYADAQTSGVMADADESDPLSGLEIAWLGSSVTYGQGAGGYSMADAIAENHPGMVSYKYAISGTTLADAKTEHAVPTDGEGSHGCYVQRMLQLDPEQDYDLFICQLSTNDATAGIPMGEISDSKDLEDLDTTTVIGAMEYIVGYAEQTWECPFMFYTGTHYDSEQYAEMVEATQAICDKWGVGLVDLWNNEEMNAVSEEDYATYMKDEIHPFREGYTDWWTPAFEEAITAYLAE